MDLRTAITRAAKFAADPKTHPNLAGMVFSPAAFPAQLQFLEYDDGTLLPIPELPAFVQATDGVITYRAYLDIDVMVPSCSVGAADVARAVASLKKQDFFVERTGDHTAVVRSLQGTIFHLPAGPAPTKLNADAPPMLWPCGDAAHVLSLLHVTKKVEKLRPDLLYIHAFSEGIETSDQARTARRPTVLPVPDGRLIHRDLWSHWPRSYSYVGFAVHGDVAFLSIDDELRWGPAVTDKDFFDLRSRVPAQHVGYRAKCSRLGVMQGAKFASNASPFDAAALTFGNGLLEICGIGADGKVESQHVIAAEGATDPVRVVVRGRLLWDSLNAQDHDVVQLGYAAPEQPLRLEGPGGYVECLWPMIPAEAPK